MSEQIDPQPAVVASIRAWSRLPDLASFAVARHGFGDTDGGFGVTYPGDLDEYDRAVEGVTIPYLTASSRCMGTGGRRAATAC
jgi:hypothetical protein